ncbi:MAG: radical SAM protein [Actinobacteria bacterium]|nr:radical SAM protein [Actinomycetota bacterium]
MNSPQYIQTSLAAAITLGLEPGRFKEKVRLTGLNLLLVYDKKCIGRCAYCGLSNQKDVLNNAALKKSSTFIRVKWPVYPLEEVIKRTAQNADLFERICVSMVTNANALRDSVHIVSKLRENLLHPISVLITPTLINSRKQLSQLKNAGADMIGVAVDTATEKLFIKYRGEGVMGPHKWEKYWQVIYWSVEIFGRYNIGIHLICGLGETEKEMVETIYKAHLAGAKTHLFSFYPEAYSLLEDLDPPELLKYRKIQIARYLINEKNLEIDKIKFDEDGCILSFDYEISEIINEGLAFMTSGCPGKNKNISACNRPLANERPSETFRNYPYIPSEEEKEIISSQLTALLQG